jgi:hypothetical protein
MGTDKHGWREIREPISDIGGENVLAVAIIFIRVHPGASMVKISPHSNGLHP